MWQSTEKEAGTQVSMEKIEQWEVLEIQTKSKIEKLLILLSGREKLLIGNQKIFTSEAE